MQKPSMLTPFTLSFTTPAYTCRLFPNVELSIQTVSLAPIPSSVTVTGVARSVLQAASKIAAPVASLGRNKVIFFMWSEETPGWFGLHHVRLITF